MWELYDKLITDIDKNIKVSDFVIGPRWTAVLSDRGAIGIAPTIIEKFSRFPFSSKPENGMSLRELAGSVKSWNFPESSLGTAALNAYYNDPAVIPADAEHMPGGRRSKAAFRNFCESTTAGCRSLFAEPYYDSDEMAEMPGVIDVVRKDTLFRDYFTSAYRELMAQTDKVILSGTALVDKTAESIISCARENNREIILWGPDLPLCKSLFGFGVSKVWSFVADDTAGLMNLARRSMERDEFLRLGHFASVKC